METLRQIWGMRFEEVSNDPEYTIYRCWVRNPYFKDGKWNIGLSKKFLNEVIVRGVKELRVVVGQAELPFQIPTWKELEKKDKKKEYQDFPSKFENSKPLRVYTFKI